MSDEANRLPRAEVVHADCLAYLPTLAEGSVDAVVCDPPAGVNFMNMAWDTFPLARRERPNAAPHPAGRGAGQGFNGVDTSRRGRDQFVAFLTSVFAECLRVCKPGAFGLVWALPRTSHWTATALEEAGWQIRDRVTDFLAGEPLVEAFLDSLSAEQRTALERALAASERPSRLSHLFGQGFPKSKSCLKPSCEDWWLVKAPGKLQPLGVDECRIAATGGLISGGCRWPANAVFSHAADCVCVGTRRVKGVTGGLNGVNRNSVYGEATPHDFHNYADADGMETVEAWECSPDCPVRLLDEQAGLQKSGGTPYRRPPATAKTKNAYGEFSGKENADGIGPSAGQVSRFFYCSKASRRDRGDGNNHPTVKSTSLCRWLLKLVCPPGGTVLDCFAGSGTTGVAALMEGRNAILVEQNADYVDIARRRLAGVAADYPLFAAEGQP